MNIAAIVASIALVFMGFAGGGGSSSGGGGGGSGYSGGSSSYHSSSSSSGDSDGDLVFTLIGVAILIIIVMLSSRNSSKRRYKDHNTTEQEKRIHTAAEHIFKSYQEDWSEFRLDDIKSFTTDHYYNHASLMLELLKNLHRANKVSKLKVRKVYLLDPVDENTTLPANLRVAFDFSGLDEVINSSGKKLYTQYVPNAVETWNFVYDGENLKLSGISQPTESAPHLVKSLADFARANHLFYSPDWGRYALPARGLIFGKASMEIADINNHIIGKWALKPAEKSAVKTSATSDDGLLIQLYTYAPTPGQSTSSYYIVGQINVPKDYLGVIVKSRKFKTKSKPDKSYDKFEMEWGEFNDRYEVYAASRDALPAFELLNPKFMEFLYAKNPSYNLEVVDNVIYIYANIGHVTEQDYADMLEVLKKAYDELKM